MSSIFLKRFKTVGEFYRDSSQHRFQARRFTEAGKKTDNLPYIHLSVMSRDNPWLVRVKRLNHEKELVRNSACHGRTRAYIVFDYEYPPPAVSFSAVCHCWLICNRKLALGGRDRLVCARSRRPRYPNLVLEVEPVFCLVLYV